MLMRMTMVGQFWVGFDGKLTTCELEFFALQSRDLSNCKHVDEIKLGVVHVGREITLVGREAEVDFP